MTKFHEFTLRYPLPDAASAAARLMARVGDEYEAVTTNVRAIVGDGVEVVDRVVRREDRTPALKPPVPVESIAGAPAAAAPQEPAASGGNGVAGADDHPQAPAAATGKPARAGRHAEAAAA